MSLLETEIDILGTLFQDRRNVSQRDLARIIGLSLDMTNAILKRLMEKGEQQEHPVHRKSQGN